MRISDWSSDVCSSDLVPAAPAARRAQQADDPLRIARPPPAATKMTTAPARPDNALSCRSRRAPLRSEEHTSELQSLMRISYAVFCLKKKKTNKQHDLLDTFT